MEDQDTQLEVYFNDLDGEWSTPELRLWGWNADEVPGDI